MTLLLVLGCSDDNLETVVQTTVKFESSTLNLNEADDALIVTVVLDEPAKKEGNLEVAFSGSASNPDHYIVLPELENGVLKLSFEKGDNEVKFLILPVNDDVNTGSKSITLTLQNPTDGFVLADKTANISITDNDEGESPVETESIAVNFKVRNATISESEVDGYEIEVILERTSAIQQVVEIAVGLPNDYEYGIDFHTDPEMFDFLIPLVFEAGETSEMIKFYPANNNVVEANAELIFTISNWSEGLKQGSEFDLLLTVEEDDVINSEIHTIAELKAYFSTHEGVWYFSTDYFIEGVVTSIDNVPTNKFIYIQDQTGGILISFILDNLLSVGQKVRLNLKNATGHEVNGQKAMLEVEDRLGTILAENIAVQPIEITIDDLIKGTYAGQMVRLKNVSFPHADGVKKWEGSHPLSDGTNKQGIVTTFNRAGFSQETLPKGNFEITGIAGSWNHLHITGLYDLKF
ncbi:hypothetical protein SAMN05421640_2160 [Ekhidna lutea]|uniref:Uncharacterized protein n=2 Tax=Ekhidna lutea TaxID=447679 RepID=A0A239JGE7_EKHLU|nr:hypothetical protein SAMN05421640_2160 [Ekhidna lutea]